MPDDVHLTLYPEWLVANEVAAAHLTGVIQHQEVAEFDIGYGLVGIGLRRGFREREGQRICQSEAGVEGAGGRFVAGFVQDDVEAHLSLQGAGRRVPSLGQFDETKPMFLYYIENKPLVLWLGLGLRRGYCAKLCMLFRFSAGAGGKPRAPVAIQTAGPLCKVVHAF